MAAISSRISSASSLRVRSSAAPKTAISTPSLCMVNSETMGRSVSAGKVDMASTRLLISFSAWISSAPVSSSTMTLAAPSPETEVIRSMS